MDAASLPPGEIELTFIRASGPGGQHVNKVSTAVHLRFDVAASSLPAPQKARVLARPDSRLSSDGVLIIKCGRHRSREKNVAEAMARLDEVLQAARVVRKRRVPTKPGKAAKQRRLDNKQHRGKLKSLRSRVDN